MSCIHYKFKSSLDYNSVTFDGLHLSLADLKKAIIQQKRLKPGEFDLEITNAQTGDVYKKNDELIAKNTSVIVSRVPMNKTTASSTQKSWEAFKQECAKVKEKERLMTLEKLKQTPDLVNAPASEIDKIKAVIDQSTKGFESSNLLGKNQTGTPHENYVCKRCGQRGHFVASCPNSNVEDRIVEPRYKRTTGIPSTMLTIVDDPLHPGALLTHHGQFAVPTVDVLGYMETKKERPPFLPGESHPEPPKKKIPQELLCHICEDLCVDAAIAPCCGTSFCDECLREVLLESEDHQCPSCKETNVSPDRIVANRSMRLAVTNFLNDTGYTKAKRRRTMSSGPETNQTNTLPPRRLSPNKSASSPSSGNQRADASPTYSDSKETLSTSNLTHQGSQIASDMNRHHNPHYRSYNRPSRYQHSNYSKPWRRYADRHNERNPGTSWRNDSDYNSHSYRQAENTSARDKDDTTGGGLSASDSVQENGGVKEPILATPQLKDGLSLTPQPQEGLTSTEEHQEGESSRRQHQEGHNQVHQRQEGQIPTHHRQERHQPPWPPIPTSLPDSQANVNFHLLNAAIGFLANGGMPLINGPPPTHHPYPAIPGYHLGYPVPRPPVPVPTAVPTSVPLSKEEFYQAKKILQQTEVPKKKPIDVFDSFADFTKRRTPERRRSYSRSRSGSWKKHSRSRSSSLGKKRSLTPRRRSSRSRSRSGLRARSRSLNRSRSRSLGPSRLSKLRSRSLTPTSRKSKSRSRSGPRSPKPLSSRASPLPPLRRSSKSPLSRRSRSRSYKRFSRSRSKSWSKRERSRSYSRPRSPRTYSRSPRRSPRRSPIRSPLRKSSYSPRRKSKSFSPHRRSPFRSRSRTPLSKRKISRSRTRSPFTKRSSFSPALSPPRAKSPYKKPMSPIPFRRRSPSPHRGGGGGYYRGRGRGRYGYEKYRNYHSPPRQPAPVPVPVLPNNLPPVPYNPQMGLPPPEEYFKHNPVGYQEFVRNFYAQFGPQAQAWAQSQTFQLPTTEGAVSSFPQANPYIANQRMPWESVVMSPSERPRSITPPRYRKEQSYRDNTRQWDRRPDRGRGGDRMREFDQHRKDVSERKYTGKEEERKYMNREEERKYTSKEEEKPKYRDSRKESKDGGRSRDKYATDRRSSPKSKDESKSKDKKRHEKKKEEKKSKKRSDSETKRESVLKVISLKTSPVSDQEMTSSPPVDPKHSQDIVKLNLESEVEAKSVPTDSPLKVQQSVPDVEKDKIVTKERKSVGKKKTDGLGTKKKSKEGLLEDGVEKKGKKTKKKKLTFGSSDADSKQGLKKKKAKRPVDYKSENNVSEDGEERVSPLKKAKLSEVGEKTDDTMQSASGELDHVQTTEPTFEVSTEVEASNLGDNLSEEKSTDVLSSAAVSGQTELTSQNKTELVPELPELSKWEREDFDLFEALEQPKEKPQEKMMLPRSVVDKAEKFLSYKPMKNAVIAPSTTMTSKSPESPPPPEKRNTDTAASRRVFIERKDSRDKKTELQITVKTDKNKNDNSNGKRHLTSKYEETRHHYRHSSSDFEEDQRSVVKSRSLERELQEKAKSRKSKEKERKREEKESKRDSRSYKENTRDDSSKKDKTDILKEKPKESESKERRHSKDLSGGGDIHKSSKDLRHKLEEKAKSKTAIDPRKLSVLDESEFVPDYEDLGVDVSSDKETDNILTSHHSGASTPDSPALESKRRKKEEEETEGDTRVEETTTDNEETSKHKKSKKKHKHKEKKEKHKHKKKKHKHKKSKEEKEVKAQTSKPDST
ncbi:E3 ubiquitin-protein ligase RBBP6-like [Biomphalaria glabrata]|uniref:E3 ubiquitin-protein ligase RBBP6-like n=1 Tax=Biomphalaria glabrata TaxID=6526 RepID=A0A9U8EDJ4_BIOGL|nr:E3 ubiquitin-protein ligase RBBP6-like [Biomphalaria glabrata]